jgi:hypothetical protein
MDKDELHNHIKSVSEDYISKSWNSFLDLDEIDLIMAGIGVGKIIAGEQEKRIEKLKAQYDYAFNQLCKSREILCSMLSQYRDKKEIDYSTRECGEKLLKEGIYKND